MKNHKRKTSPKRLQAKRDSLSTLLKSYKQSLDIGKERLFHLCVKMYEQMLTREDIQKLVLEVCDVTPLEAFIIATRLHRMSHDADALQALIDGEQEIARRYTLRKSML